MPIIFVILGAIVVCNAAWWRWADRRLRSVKNLSEVGSRLARVAVAVFIGGQLLYLCTIFSPRRGHAVQQWVPTFFVAVTYLWNLIVLPVSLLVTGIIAGFRKLRGKPLAVQPVEQSNQTVSRRKLFQATAVAIPPLVTAGLVLRSLPQLTTFRVRSISLQMPGLPRSLDGLRIAHVSDLHVGRYTRPAQMPRMVDAVNRMAADLVLFTGDLIDVSIEDLPRGIDALKRIDPRSGMVLIEGNHDLIDNPDEFDRQVRAAGLSLLVDQAQTVKVRGEKIQLLGTRWGSATGNRRQANESTFRQSIQTLNHLRDPEAFPILLAHHPHAFDAAVASDYPLTLSGHTHGGQMMLSPTVGFGPLFYRYWSGIYKQGNSQLVVNNGVGNWFPLRINAPAEIIELTLRSTG